MSEKLEITARLAQRLKDERKEKGLSLDALANLSGLSRSMLSQIERGESSPTVASLWKLTNSLNLDFTTLLDEESASSSAIHEVLSANQIPTLKDTDLGYEIRILSPSSDVGGTEVYDIEMIKGAVMDSAAHKAGCTEHLSVLEGELRISSDKEEETVKEGATIRYRADVHHKIEALSAARFILVVQNS